MFNLEVDGAPEFFANGVLVHNCRVHHVGTFPKLEDEMTQWDPMNQVESPNRVDALVHGLTELLVHPAPPSYSSSRGSGPRFRV